MEGRKEQDDLDANFFVVIMVYSDVFLDIKY